MALGLTAVYYVDVSNVVLVFHTKPLILVPIAFIILGETVSRSYPISLLACFAGVILVIQPPFLFQTQDDDNNPIGYLFALCGMMVHVVIILIQRK